MQTPKPRRGVASIADLRARATVDPVTHCWHWQGAKVHGRPRIWTLDLDRMEKLVMNGPRAVWYIAHGTRLGTLQGWMGCGTLDCVCPVHVRRGTRSAWNSYIAATGRGKRESTPARLAAGALGRAAAGHVDTPAETVLALRAAHAAGQASRRQLMAQHGVSKSTYARIVSGKAYRHLMPESISTSPTTPITTTQEPA